MLIHNRLPMSTVNGPGSRAVIWFQGCSLACPGCWNPSTHSFARGSQISPKELAGWILSCPEIEGVTLSGGEPFQQAGELLRLVELLHRLRPDLTIGLFTGYTLKELVSGTWKWLHLPSMRWERGSPKLFERIRECLDFAVMGRFIRGLTDSQSPLCGSTNQRVVFFTGRYSQADLEPQAYEVLISGDGEQVTTTGFPHQLVNITL